MKNFFHSLASVSLLLFFVLPNKAVAQDMPENDEAGLHKTRFSFKHSFDTLYSRNKDPEKSEDQSLKTYDAYLSVPIYQNDKMSASIFGKTQELHFASLPANTLTTSDDFYDLQYGLRMSYKENDEKAWHLNSAYGSASNKPFESGDVSTLSVTLMRKQTLDLNNSWTFFLNYSNNRTFLNGIPLPGAAYNHVGDDLKHGWVLGFPFSLYWARPVEKVSTSFFILFPSTLRAQIGYMFQPRWQSNLKLQTGQDVFILANRQEKDVRFFYETKKLAVGLKRFLTLQNFFELELAKNFGRSIFNGKSSLNLTSDRVDLADEWQLTASLQTAL